MKAPSKPKIDKAIFQTIFIDHWDSFKKSHPKYDSPQYDVPVRKMLGCGKKVAVIVSMDVCIVVVMFSK